MDAGTSAVVGALFGALGGAISGWLASRHRTTGAIREKSIELAEFTSRSLWLKPSSSCSGSQYVEIIGNLVTYFIHTIQHAENKRGTAPVLPPEVKATMDSGHIVVTADTAMQQDPAKQPS